MGCFQSQGMFSSPWLICSQAATPDLQKSLIREGWRVNQRNHLLSPLSGAAALLRVTWSSLYSLFYKPYHSLSGWIIPFHRSYWQAEKLFRFLHHRHLLQLSHASAFTGGFFHAGWTAQCCPLQWTAFSGGKHSYSFQPLLIYLKGAGFCTILCVLAWISGSKEQNQRQEHTCFPQMLHRWKVRIIPLSTAFPLDIAEIMILFHNLWMLLTEQHHTGKLSASWTLFSALAPQVKNKTAAVE